MARAIPLALLDRALDNLSDVPVVQRAYDYGYGGDKALAIFWGENGDGEVHDWTTFLLTLVRLDEALASDLAEALRLDRPSYRGNWFTFPGWTLPDGEVSRYEVNDFGDKVTSFADLDDDEKVAVDA